MKHEKFDTAAYRNAIQENFSGADGWDNFSADPTMNFEGSPELNANGIVDAPAAPELTFTVTNSSTTVSATCKLFGASLYLTDTYFGSAATITVTPDFGVSYTQVLRDTSTAPFTVGSIRMQSSNTSQVTQGLTVVSTNIYGASKSDPINMVTAVSEYQQQLTIARSTKPFDITGDVYFSFPVLASTTVTVTVYVKNKVNIARQLEGRAVSGLYAAPNTGIKPLMVAPGGAIKQLGK